MAKTKKTPPKKKKFLKEVEKFLEQFEKDEMLDDHGHMIVGLREEPPTHDTEE